MQFHDAAATARLLDPSRLDATLKDVLREHARGEIFSPERLVVPCGNAGLLLSMPCGGRDLVVHKLLTVYGRNPARGLPAIQGQVSCFDADTGTPLFCLDGPTVTARRTAAITIVAIDHLRPDPPRSVTVIGTGVQAHAHVAALLARYPEALIRVRGSSAASEGPFCARFSEAGARVGPHAPGPVGGEVVIAVTSSRRPVFDEAADPARLVIGVGAYRLDMIEIGSRTIGGSQVYVDDIVGAPGEAGDVVAAGTDWSRVKALATALDEPPDFSRPIMFKSVGCGAWDLAACRTARAALARGADDTER